ncbi:Shikimate/quinate 5-dehydrogenase [Sulfobacillus acidophilus TPY]|uniref:Shikimate/quinate 5-dehydrogenase n=1 Tax=Sulfobacillus acidophilus (strain ATCC 700253 / DSM 10332 / NAL) TaxID=679936 RepID=G8TY62_SULAD|nr:Shikimate/quinate 5-dehydrogenase [Sulfobacillus acidophilus TPY]AEW03969.1 Shikimate/quinate 5-dehydrogenase [Sulfobacillus acidophilus DSM 10332]
MRRFAFIIHPLRFDDFARKYGFTRYLPPKLVEWAFKQVGPVMAGHVTGVRSPAGEELEGWLIGLPLTPEIILSSPYDWVLRKLTAAGELAERLGAEIVGLGAFTKIAGDRGISLAKNLHIPVTTGNSYTTATAVEGTLAAAREMGISVKDAATTVIGATGSIGRAASFELAEQVKQLTLVARTPEKLEALRQDLLTRHPHLDVKVTTDIPGAVRPADIVIAVSSATGAIVDPDDLKPGAVITDVARPRNLSRVVTERRPDVLVLDGGVIQVPGESADMGFDFGFPPKMVEACMAETMILALEGRLENFTIGPSIATEKVREIHRLGSKHGFKLAGFRRFERAIDNRELDRIRQAAAERLRITG